MFCSCSARRSSSRERPLELLGRHPQRADEADARLDGDDEQVDQRRQLLVDLVEARLDLPAQDDRRQRPAEQRRDDDAEHEDGAGGAAEGGDGDPDEEEGHREDQLPGRERRAATPSTVPPR